jgi:hypothetical protein
MKTQLIEMIRLIQLFNPDAPSGTTTSLRLISLIAKRERRAICAYLRTNYHNNNLYIITEFGFLPYTPSQSDA